MTALILIYLAIGAISVPANLHRGVAWRWVLVDLLFWPWIFIAGFIDGLFCEDDSPPRKESHAGRQREP